LTCCSCCCSVVLRVLARFRTVFCTTSVASASHHALLPSLLQLQLLLSGGPQLLILTQWPTDVPYVRCACCIVDGDVGCHVQPWRLASR
jgi:hypothetical protein